MKDIIEYSSDLKTGLINDDCECYFTDCERHGNCVECQKYHRKHKSKTSCGK